MSTPRPSPTATPGRGHTLVVGAGVGGLSAAALLAQSGQRVTLLEAQAKPGGKLRTVASAAGPVDAGPTVFAFRAVFDELFEALGTSTDAELAPESASLLARHRWPDGPGLDLFADRAASEAAVAAFAGGEEAAAFARFSARAQQLFDAFEGPVMRAQAPSALSVAASVMADAGRLLPAMAPGRTLWQALCREFTDPRLRQLFGRYATYVGGSPFLSPALLMLIWHSEARGVCLIPGGMVRLAERLSALFQAAGGVLRTQTPVAEILVERGRVAGVQTETGERIAADQVLFNGDPGALGAGLLGDGARRAAPALAQKRRSLSAWVWTLAGRAATAPLAHHTVLFSGDSRAEFQDLFARRRLPADPTLYICAQDRAADGSGAPATERFQIIMNAPADGDCGAPRDKEFEACETRVFRALEAAGLGLNPVTLEGTLTTPWDFARRFPGTGGALYGANPHGMLAALSRPTARSALPGLYLAGGGCHPGPGVPMAALSGRLAAAAMLADRVSTSAWRRMAMRGGMSMASPTTAGARSRSSVS